MKQVLVLLAVLFGTISPDISADDLQLQQAYESRQSDVQIKGAGTVVRLLADDNEGHRHQRFILMLSSKQTLLIAHNIDLAPRIPDLRVGDNVQFYGEYEWNQQGGVIHWTHGDANNQHAHGWLKHRGKVYE